MGNCSWRGGEKLPGLPGIVPTAFLPGEVTSESSSSSAKKAACQLRIISINDVYELDNLPRFKTLVQACMVGRPRENVIVTLAGDFLAPSLLSSLDAGCGMVKILNSIPVDIVCFGNHESDIPYTKLQQRIAEFRGTWLNSNMPEFRPELPRYCVRKLRGNSGVLGARTVAFMGLCVGGGRHRSVYRDGAFGGAAASMIPVNEAACALYTELRARHPLLDEIIPLTHQDMPDDVDLAQTGMFPVIIAGHDHELINQREGGRLCPIVKAGQDATHAAVVDLEWPDEPGALPDVVTKLEDLKAYPLHPTLAEKIERIKRPVYELEEAILYELEEGEVLSSENVRFEEVSMAKLVATALRDLLHSDAAILNSGAIRGNRTYSDSLSYGDLKRECPFPSPIIVLPLPFDVLQRAVHESRRSWWDRLPGAPPGESAGALQVDEGMEVDPQHWPISIRHKKPSEAIPGDEEVLYQVACDTRVLKRNDVLKAYCQTYPERVPPDDAGRPVLPLLAEFFCGQLWHRLIKMTTGPLPEAHGGRTRKIFTAHQIFDVDNNGVVDVSDLLQAVARVLGNRLSSRIVVEQMIAMMDNDSDGCITARELRDGVTKMMGGKARIIVSV